MSSCYLQSFACGRLCISPSLGSAKAESDLAITKIEKGTTKTRNKSPPIWTGEEGRASLELSERKYCQQFVLAKGITLQCGDKSFP